MAAGNKPEIPPSADDQSKSGESGQGKSEKGRVPLDELLLVILAQRSVANLKQTLDSGAKISDEAMKLITIRVSKGVDNPEQRDLLDQIVAGLEGENEDKGMARAMLVELIQLQDESLETKPKFSKKKPKTKKQPSPQQEHFANQTMDVALRRDEVTREVISQEWRNAVLELAPLMQKVDRSQMVELQKIIEATANATKDSIELGINEPLSDDMRSKIQTQVVSLYDKYVQKNEKKNVAKMSWREREMLKKDNIITGRGMKTIKDFLEVAGEEEKVADLFKLKTDQEYIELFYFMDLMEENSDVENFAELYEVARRIQNSWDDERSAVLMEKTKKMTPEDNREIKRRVGNSKIPDFEKSEDAVEWIINNNVLPESKANILRDNPEGLANFLDNLRETENLRKSGYMSGQERMRNINYKHLEEINELVKKRWKKEGLDVAKLGEAIPDFEKILSGESNPMVNNKLEGKAKKILEDVVFQELLKEARRLVRESVDRSSMYYNPVAERYMTIMSLGGVDTTLKDTVTNHMILLQLSYAWRNGYVDEEVFGKVMDFWSRQGPEYRLFEEMKRNEVIVFRTKEGKEEHLEINLYDYEGVMSQNVSDDDKEALGMPKGVDRSWGTVIGRTTENDAMKHDRKIFVRRMLINKLGEAEYAKLEAKIGNEAMLNNMVDNYGDYIARSYLYWIGTGRLGEVVGNASFDNKKFELPQGIPEYYMKRDPRLLIWFLWKYTPVRVPEALFGLARMGLPSFHAANKGETAAHFISTSNTTEGGLGTRAAWYVDNGKHTTDQLDKYSKDFANLFNKALYNDKEFTFDKSNPFFKAIKHQMDKYNARRNNTDTINILLKHERETKDDGFFEAISWEWAKSKFSHDKQLIDFLNSKATGREKFVFFAKRFNDGFFMTTALKAKRGDDAKKYRFNYQGEDMKAVIEYANNPEPENLQKIASIVASIVGEAIPEFRDANIEINYEILHEREPGEALDVIEYAGGSVKFNSESYVGLNQGEFPLPAMTKVAHNPWDLDILTHSTAAYRGLEHKVYEGDLLMKTLMRNMRAATMYRDDAEYREKRKEVRKEYFKESLPKLHWDSGVSWYWNVLHNGKKMWDVVTLKKITDYIAIELVGLPPHLFWEWLFENSEKSWETAVKVLGGHGH